MPKKSLDVSSVDRIGTELADIVRQLTTLGCPRCTGETLTFDCTHRIVIYCSDEECGWKKGYAYQEPAKGRVVALVPKPQIGVLIDPSWPRD